MGTTCEHEQDSYAISPVISLVLQREMTSQQSYGAPHLRSMSNRRQVLGGTMMRGITTSEVSAGAAHVGSTIINGSLVLA